MNEINLKVRLFDPLGSLLRTRLIRQGSPHAKEQMWGHLMNGVWERTFPMYGLLLDELDDQFLQL